MDPPRRYSGEFGNQLSVLRSAVDKLEATRVTERKDGVERLLTLLSDEQYCKVLDQTQLTRSKTPGALNWSEIFRIVEILFRKEYETGNDNDRTNEKKKQIFSLLHRIISAANRDVNRPLLEPNLLLPHISRFLSHPVISIAHGQNIIKIIKHYLSIPSTVASTKGENWAACIKAVVNQIKKAELPLQPLHEILIQTIIHGSDYPDCISILRTRVVDLYKYIIGTKTAFTEHAMLIMEGFLQLCRAIAPEARGILCAAWEPRLDNILQGIQTPAEHEKACELFLVQVKLHCPFDLQGESSFWAENPAGWPEIVSTLYNYCIEEIGKVASERKQRGKNSIQIPRNLLRLSVVCTKLMQAKPNELFHVEPPPKRTKTSVEFSQLVQDTLLMPAGPDQLIWLSYIGAVLQYYPDIIKLAAPYLELLKTGTNLLTVTFISFQELFAYLRNLLHCERALLNQGVLEVKSPQWELIWDILIKSFPIQEATPLSLELMEELLVYYRPRSISSLLNLFATGKLPLTSPALRLLEQCLLTCELPHHLSEPHSHPSALGLPGSARPLRLAIINWLLPQPASSCEPSVELEARIPKLIFSLLVTRGNEVIRNEMDTLDDTNFAPNCCLEDFEKIFVKCTFVAEPEGWNTKRTFGPASRKQEGSELQCSFLDRQEIILPFLDLLREDLDTVENIEMTSPDVVKRLHHLIFRVRLYVHLGDLTVKYKVDKNVETKDTILRLLDSSLTKCAAYLPAFLVSEKRLDGIHQVLCLLNRLLSTEHLCEEIKSFLALSFPNNVVDTFLVLLKRRFERTGIANGASGWEVDVDMIGSSGCGVVVDESSGAVSLGQQKELVTVEALRCICSYATIDDRRYELLTKVVETLSRNSTSDFSQAYFDLCADFISRTRMALTYMAERDKQKQVVEKIMELLQSMCQKYLFNSGCTARLWELFAELTPMIRSLGEETKFMILVGNLSSFVYIQGIRSCRSYFRLMHKLAEFDPDLTWSCYVPKKARDLGTKYPLLELHNFLNARPPSHMIRLYAIEAIASVFRNVGWVKVDPCLTVQDLLQEGSDNGMVVSSSSSKQDRIKLWFLQIRDALSDMFNTSANHTSAEKSEEGVNCVAIVVLCLTRLAFSNKCIEQPMLYLLMKTTSERNIVQSLACRALERANPHFRKSIRLCSAINLEMWIRDGLQEHIPYRLFNCDNKEKFYCTYLKEIVALLVARGRWNDLESLAVAMKTTSVELMKLSFSEVFSKLIVKSLAAGDVDCRCADVLKKRLGWERLRAITGHSLSTLVLTILSSVLVPDICVSWDCPKILLPDLVSVPLSDTLVPVALAYIKSVVPDQVPKSVLHHLASTSPRSIYTLLLELVTRVHDAHSTHARLWRLHQFVIFVNLVLDDISDSFHVVRGYFCHFIIHGFLRFLTFRDDDKEDPAERFRRSVLFCLRKFLSALIALDREEVEGVYKLLVRRLTAFAVKAPELRDAVAPALDLLILENHGKFSIPISCLDPFPADQFFSDYADVAATYQTCPTNGLEEQLRTVVENVRSSTGVCTEETLVLIGTLLSEHKDELGELVRRLDGKRFQDECQADLIHRLIGILIQVINRSEGSEEVRMEAAKCLGEIGPVDLSVLVLPPYGRSSWIGGMTTTTTASSAVPALIRLVASYLDDEDIHVVTTTSQVMINLLDISDAVEALKGGTMDVVDGRLKSMLRPFLGSSGGPGKNVPVAVSLADLPTLESRLEVDVSWTYPEWLASLTCALIETTTPADSMLVVLKPLCILKTDFCEEVFPFVAHSLLSAGKDQPVLRNQMSAYFQNFFANFVKASVKDASGGRSGQETDYSLYRNKAALRTLLRCAQFLREHPVPPEFKGKVRGTGAATTTTPWDNNFWLDFNYLDMAKAAQYCGAYLTSIMFEEIYALGPDAGKRLDVAKPTFETQVSGNYFDLSAEDREEVEKLLVKAYIKIGEPDGVYGCGAARFSDFSSEIQHLESSQSWNQVLLAYDSRCPSDFGVCNSIKNLGLYNTCWTQLWGIEARRGGLDESVADIQYECGWRLSQWDINYGKVTYLEDTAEWSSAKGTFQKSVYESVRAALKKDVWKLRQWLRRGCEVVLEELKNANLESSETLYGFLSQLQILRVIEDMSETKPEAIKDANTKWKTHHAIPSADFKYEEPILSLRKVMLSALKGRVGTASGGGGLGKACDDVLLDLAVKARESGRLELAVKYAHEVSGLEENSVRKDVEIAKNHWARGKRDIALHVVSNVLSRIPHQDPSNTYPSLLLLHGEWLFASVAERPSIIFQRFQNACDLYVRNPRSTPEDISKTYITLGEYADTQFQRLVDYVQSDLFQQKVDHLRKSNEEQTKMMQYPQDADTKKTLHFMKKQYQIDNEEITNTYFERRKYQSLALEYYMKALKLSDKYDLFIFRTIALWLSNSPSDVSSSVSASSAPKAPDVIMSENSIASYKYISVLHQLSARLGTSSKATSDLIDRILLRCAGEHPYHTLPVLLTQAMLYKDKQVNGKGGGGGSSSKHESGEERITAAGRLLTKLKKGKKLGALAGSMETLWNALISLANFQDPKGVVERRAMPAQCELMNMTSLNCIPVLTLNIPVNPSGKYDDILSIKGFKSHYQLVGGINSPKKITCIAANGQHYNMLLKGNDDLRQDAVMQQVFGVMNQLLEADAKTKKKRLLVRTYKVVPLSQRSGIIEWCENTQTFGDYLVGSGEFSPGAHAIYRPNDLRVFECRRMMNEVKDCRELRRKHEVFVKILEKFKPVFHHFFFENFKDAGSFFERRLAYTRSVATSSIVGYMLGLGDRHVQNILIDKNTAEVIHIDLGVAFEQGKLLPTPETIPFRLTRDIVDGMGFSGPEGVFRRSCEDTMEVLRKNADIILTILEVLLYDPLYLWTLTEDRKRKLQPAQERSQSSSSLSSSSTSSKKNSSLLSSMGESESCKRGEQNNTAAGELRRLKSKLAGIQEGRTSGSTISVPGHVSQLINNAMDTHLLSRLFPGWQPYL